MLAQPSMLVAYIPRSEHWDTGLPQPGTKLRRSKLPLARPWGVALLAPLRRGTTVGLSVLVTPCRKERGVPLAKGDKTSLLTQ